MHNDEVLHTKQYEKDTQEDDSDFTTGEDSERLGTWNSIMSEHTKQIVELPVVNRQRTMNVKGRELLTNDEIFDKSSERIARLVNKTWLCRYPRFRYLIYDNGSEFKLHFEHLCDSYGIKHKPNTVRNPQANAILERVHQVIGQMLRTAEAEYIAMSSSLREVIPLMTLMKDLLQLQEADF